MEYTPSLQASKRQTERFRVPALACFDGPVIDDVPCSLTPKFNLLDAWDGSFLRILHLGEHLSGR